MDNSRLSEVASEYSEQVGSDGRRALEMRVELLEARIDDLIKLLLPARFEKLEQRLDLMVMLKSQGLDLSKFTFDIKPLAS